MRTKTTNLVKSALMIAIALVIQYLGQSYPYINQYFVGPIINAVLILTVCTCGIGFAASVGAVTPILALITGILPSAMVAFVPFIILGNIIFSFSFALAARHLKFGQYLGILSGAFLKFAFLSLSATKLIHILNLGFKPTVAKKLAQTMGFTQFITALTGGVLALILIKLLGRRRAL